MLNVKLSLGIIKYITQLLLPKRLIQFRVVTARRILKTRTDCAAILYNNPASEISNNFFFFREIRVGLVRHLRTKHPCHH